MLSAFFSKFCVMVMMIAKLILLYSSSPFLHWPTFCLQNVYRIRYICCSIPVQTLQKVQHLKWASLELRLDLRSLHLFCTFSAPQGAIQVWRSLLEVWWGLDEVHTSDRSWVLEWINGPQTRHWLNSPAARALNLEVEYVQNIFVVSYSGGMKVPMHLNNNVQKYFGHTPLLPRSNLGHFPLN